MFTTRWTLLIFSLTLLSLAFVACGGSSTEPEPEPTPVATVESTAASPASEAPQLTVALASTDLAVGENRVSFGVIQQGEGPIKNAEVEVQTFVITDAGLDGPKQTVPASFREWPGGSGGVYVAHLSFDQAGEWGLGILLTQSDGTLAPATTKVQVKEQSLTTAIGAPAIRSDNKTLDDVFDIDELTTDTEPDPDMYAMTIAEALDENKPLLVTFATPAYCRTATCGPQLDVVKEIKSGHSDEMNFLHIEVYDNPDKIQGDLTKGEISPTLAEWGLITEPWTFVMDAEGLVQAKFEGFVGPEDLETAIQSVLQ
ncbi:MAG: FixH family protein [SAR202 cluster bacterium]|nr:FixH family protein [SAR202 cluster bacterium]MDP6713884.1 FixH family protein [SAR202 cluster bacterium]